MLKQFVIVSRKPKMSPGKMASQVAHATFLALERENKKILKEWKMTGMCVIVLQCKDSVQLMGISGYLNYWKVTNHLYIDEGLTEVEMGSPTALATGIIGEDKQWMFNNFKLYNEGIKLFRWNFYCKISFR